jgi:DDE family transposase
MVQSHCLAFRVYVNHLRLPWSKPQRENLVFLGGAFVERRSLPVRRLARAVAGPGEEHRYVDKRLRRFLGNARLGNEELDAALACHLRFLLPRFGAAPFIPVMVDWMFIDGWAVLWAQIPYAGRALPLCVSVHRKHLKGDEVGRTQAEQQLLTRLRACWPTGVPEPLLLMDRGFDKAPLLRWLIEGGWRFICRVQRGNHLYDAEGELLNDRFDALGELVHRGPLHPPPGQVILFPNVVYTSSERLDVRLAVSACLDPETGKTSEWRLVNNVPEERLRHVPNLYAHRMSPEGVHRDSKRGHFVSGFALSHMARMRKDRLERLIFMLGLIYGFLVLVAETERETRAWLCKRHWGLSLATFALELLHQAGSAARRITQQACATVQFQPGWLRIGDC